MFKKQRGFETNYCYDARIILYLNIVQIFEVIYLYLLLHVQLREEKRSAEIEKGTD